MILTLKEASQCRLWDIRTWFSGEHLRDSLRQFRHPSWREGEREGGRERGSEERKQKGMEEIEGKVHIVYIHVRVQCAYSVQCTCT